jgi:hypothetical protein
MGHAAPLHLCGNIPLACNSRNLFISMSTMNHRKTMDFMSCVVIPVLWAFFCCYIFTLHFWKKHSLVRSMLAAAGFQGKVRRICGTFVRPSQSVRVPLSSLKAALLAGGHNYAHTANYVLSYGTRSYADRVKLIGYGFKHAMPLSTTSNCWPAHFFTTASSGVMAACITTLTFKEIIVAIALAGVISAIIMSMNRPTVFVFPSMRGDDDIYFIWGLETDKPGRVLDVSCTELQKQCDLRCTVQENENTKRLSKGKDPRLLRQVLADTVVEISKTTPDALTLMQHPTLDKMYMHCNDPVVAAPRAAVGNRAATVGDIPAAALVLGIVRVDHARHRNWQC